MRIVQLLGLLISLSLRAQVWEPLNGPLAVEVSEVEVNSSDVLFFITAQGLHRSLDNGDTWELLDNGLPTTGLSDLLVAPNNHVFVFGPGFTLYRSVDDGVSWSMLSSFLFARCLAANAQGVLLMGMGSGNLNRSFDDGNTWTLSPGTADGDRTSSPPVLEIHSSLASMFRSFPAVPFARSTVASPGPRSPSEWGLPTNCIGVNASGHVFAGTELGMTGLLRSTDGGTTWTQLDIDSCVGYRVDRLQQFRSCVHQHPLQRCASIR